MKLSEMSADDVTSLLDAFHYAKRAWLQARRDDSYGEIIDHPKGYKITVHSDEYNQAADTFNALRNDIIGTFGLRATRYDKTSITKYRDAQQIAETLTNEQALKIWRRAGGH